MAFPWIFHSNFEQGNSAEWDSETDTANQMDFPHVSDLAKTPWPTAVPYSGAYCMRCTLAGGTADAFLVEGDLDVADNTLRHISFKMWFDPDFIGTADDVVNVLELKASSTVEATFGFRVVAASNVINLGIGETAPTSFSGEAIERGRWYTVELEVEVDESTEDDGTIDLYVTKEDKRVSTGIAATQVASLDQGAVTTGVFGIQDHLATTLGTILFDEFKLDDARIYAEETRPISRYDNILTKSGHAFIGAGRIDDVVLMPGAAADGVLTVYDTNAANTLDASNIVGEVKNVTNSESVNLPNTPIYVKRGAYVTLTGTTPRGQLRFSNNNAHGKVSVIKQFGKSGEKR